MRGRQGTCLPKMDATGCLFYENKKSAKELWTKNIDMIKITSLTCIDLVVYIGF